MKRRWTGVGGEKANDVGKKDSNDRVEESKAEEKEDKNKNEKECLTLLPKAFFDVISEPPRP
eukprot:CAMPEP_0118642944 /NCGR_PEP_ID=MMETSP0785-20121206/6107_1 /TAXON_ID=91992 /ORGANISM="Bolidomonas pacifica, Strain CCMP 1866" /LENGTH=61 /DNA_ID=CAMNT_0006534533 /DNA_START=1944 /DNA_END=2129 /DNA_ORIENTATION=-